MPAPHPRSPAPPPALARVAEAVHSAAAEEPVPQVARTTADGVVALWPVPAEVAHPADVLVGVRAPAHWPTLGLAVSGRAWEAGLGPTDVRVTVVADRRGHLASVLELAGQEPGPSPEPPDGWVADALRRALGLPTAPPAVPLSHLVEAVWVDRLAAVALGEPHRLSCWADVACLHPLADHTQVLPGTLLGVNAMALDLETSWSRIRRRWAGDLERTASPPGVQEVPADRWFDDGSFSRWVERGLPPLEEVLAAVLATLPDDVAGELCDSLTQLRPPPWW